MDYRRLEWLIRFIAAAGIMSLELLRRKAGGSGTDLWWLWYAISLVCVLIFTRIVFAHLTRVNRSLQVQETRSERLFNSTGVGMVLIGSGCRIERANPAAERLTGFPAGELVGRAVCSDLFARGPDGRPVCFDDCLALGVRSGTAPVTTMTLQTRGGGQLSVAVSVTLLNEGEFHLFFWDISERTRLERELARRRRQAEQLYEAGRTMTAMNDLDRNLERLLAKAREVMEADIVGWGTLGDGPLELQWQVVVGTEPGFAQQPLSLQGTVAGRVLAAGRPYVTKHLAADLVPQADAVEGIAAERVLAAMAVPLQARDRQYGVLFVGYRRHAQLSDEDLLLLSNLGSHLSVAVDNADLLRRVQHMATLEERQRLAREMHDSFGQILTYFGMRLHLLEGLLRNNRSDQALVDIAELKAVLHDAHHDVRRSIYRLKESGPPQAPLWDRWVEHLRLFQSQTGIAVEANGKESVPALLPETVETQLTRVIQEALVNVRNHSGAERVYLDAYRNGGDLVVTVRDDGCGFDASKANGPEQYHFGLSIMRERIRSIGGTLEIVSEAGYGTQVRVTTPVVGGGGANHATA